MQFSCDQCATRYSVPDERVRGKRVRTKCRKCGGEIIVVGPPGPPASGATSISIPPAPPSEVAGPAPGPPETTPDRSAPANPPPPAPPEPRPGSFDFDDEATAVIAPDRARELLEAEAAKSEEPPESEAPETPLAFGFDDESTKVFDSANAEASMGGEPPEIGPTPPAPDTLEPPGPAQSSDATADTTPKADADAPGREEPSIVVAEGVGATKPRPKAKAPTPPPEPPKLSTAHDIIGLQNEPTRVVRLRKQGMGGSFWIVLFLALAAAAAGGFVASQLLEHPAHRGHPKP